MTAKNRQEPPSQTPPPEDDLLDEALDESFPASDPPAASHFD